MNEDDRPPLPEEPPEDFWDSMDEEDEAFLEENFSAPPHTWFPTEIELGDPDPNVTEAARELEDEVTRRQKLENDQLEQANGQRAVFLRFTITAAAVPIIASSLCFIWLVITADSKDMTIIAPAFFASVVAEVIGMSIILAKYLFPAQGPGNSKPADLKDD